MSSNRLKLHELLVGILGSNNVYFQPPETVKMRYPCIVYSRNSMNTKYANDKQYSNRICYSIAIIDQNPDSDIPEKIRSLPLCRFDRHYTADNLNHDVYNIYF